MRVFVLTVRLTHHLCVRACDTLGWQAFNAPHPTSAGFGYVPPVAAAMPVNGETQTPSVLTKQRVQAVVQLTIPEGSAPGSTLNVTLSDGRTVRGRVSWAI